jgi:hypothetical protein
MGTKGAIPRRNSGSKLSALAEERGRKKRTTKKTTSNPTEKTSSGGFDIITQSCLLGFSEGEEDSDLEEANFPLSLTTSLSSSLTEETDAKGVELKGEESQDLDNSRNILEFVGRDAVHFAPASPRPKSSAAETHNEQDAKQPWSGRKRSSSFTYQRNPRLSQQLAALNTKASNLSAHSDPFDPKFQTPPSLSSEISLIKAPFLFTGATNGHCLPPTSRRAPQSRGYRGEVEEEEGGVDVHYGSLKLSDIVRSLIVVQEMHAMAKARQGPILLLSTSADLVS